MGREDEADHERRLRRLLTGRSAPHPFPAAVSGSTPLLNLVAGLRLDLCELWQAHSMVLLVSDAEPTGVAGLIPVRRPAFAHQSHSSPI